MALPLDLYGQIAFLLLLAVAIAALLLPFRFPSILAYLACGVLFGPAAIDLRLDLGPVELFAHLGISLLLLVVGLRLDIHLLRNLGFRLLWAALLQIGITALLGWAVSWLLGFVGLERLYLGLALALSSTVLVVKLLSDRREIDALYGRIAVGILLVQDLLVVLVLLSLALLGGDQPPSQLLWLPLKGFLFLLATVLAGRYLVPPLFGHLAQSRELLMLAALAWGLGLGTVSDRLGFSHELGAFIGGVVLAATPYRDALSSRLVALRDFLLPFFFVQLGTHLDPRLIPAVWQQALGLSLLVLILKPLLLILLLRLFGFGLYNGGLAGLALGQISEFSLILASRGLASGHLEPPLLALITLSAFLTMALSSFAISNLHPLFHTLFPLIRPFDRRERPFCPLPAGTEAEAPTAIVIGLGRYGLRLAVRLKTFGFRVLGVDFDPLRVEEASRQAVSACYLDAEAVERLPLHRAEWVVSTVRLPATTETVVRALKAVGYTGRIAAVAYQEEERNRLERLGIDLILMTYRDAADHAAELIRKHRQGRLGGAFAWHAMEAEEVCRHLGVQPKVGLTFAEAKHRLVQVGENRLPTREAPPWWEILLRQFESFLILILVAAAGVAWFIGDLKDAVAILAVVLLNAALGFFQEYRAERALIALRHMLTQKVRVLREGRVWLLPIEELVPGDVVLLEAGDRVPADGRLIEAASLMVDESSLTGESVPVAKQVAPVPEESPVAERRSMVFMNSYVTRGLGRFVVTATGTRTEIGRLAQLLAEEEEPPTPLQIQLDQLGKRLALLVVLVVSGLLGFSWWRGEPLWQAFFTSVALAVAAIPEGLPAVVTVTLAVGMSRLARQKAVVRRLVAVETLGCTSVICSDKTGTITQNRLTVERIYFRGRSRSLEGLQGEEAAPLLLPAVLCNEASGESGDPLEVALLRMARALAFDWEEARRRFPKVAEIPFDASLRFMATFHDLGAGSEPEGCILLCIKGAPEVLLSRSRFCLMEEGVVPLTPERSARWQEMNRQFARAGLRVIGTAWRRLKREKFSPNGDLHRYLEGLTLTGWIGLIDPPRPEVPEAIRTCRRAGVQVKMVTGDQPSTAVAIARAIGLQGEVLTGSELAKLTPDELAERIDRIAIFARTTPEQKVQIVRTLKMGGEVVAVTGDGVNDAPALKSADIGIAMGSGTEVAKEAAAMVLLDDHFATIVAAIRGGRTIFENILKFLRFQLSTNFAAILSISTAPFFGLPLPFHPIQILWINLIMDGPPAMALGVDPPRPDVMEHPPRSPSEPILNVTRIGQALFWGVVRAAGTLAVLAWALRVGMAEERALTLAFTTFVLFQLFNAFNARSGERSAFSREQLKGRWLWLALLAVLAIQIAVVHLPPLQAFFHTTELTPREWGIAFLVAGSILPIEEIRRLIVRLIRRRP